MERIENRGEVVLADCEFDKQNRIIDTMVTQGYKFDPSQSRVKLVFKKEEGDNGTS